MTYREMQAWVTLIGCMVFLSYFAAKWLGWLERLDIGWFWIGASIVFLAALVWTLSRSEPADERDMLVQLKSLSLAARIHIFGLMAVMLVAGGGSQGSVTKNALFSLLAVAAAAGAARQIYLYRYAV